MSIFRRPGTNVRLHATPQQIGDLLSIATRLQVPVRDVLGEARAHGMVGASRRFAELSRGEADRVLVWLREIERADPDLKKRAGGTADAHPS
jgi:hypothetical protein